MSETETAGTAIREEHLSTRAYLVLKRAGLETWEAVASASDRDLIGCRNCGKITFREIRARQATLLPNSPPGPPPDREAFRQLLAACQAAYGALWCAYSIESETQTGLRSMLPWDGIEKLRAKLRASLKTAAKAKPPTP